MTRAGTVGTEPTDPGRSAVTLRARVDRARRELEAGLHHNAQGHPSRASGRFRAAVTWLGTADPVVAEAAYIRARALLGLVMSDFELRADIETSMATLDEALALAERAGAGAVQVAIEGQRGLLHMRAGDSRAALAALDRAVAGLDDAEPVDTCVVLLNRGSLLLELGDLAAARVDLERCAERARALGDLLVHFKARHNLGYLEFLAGDLPLALATMAEASRIEHGGSPAIALLDRAQVLLEAGLVTEADATLGQAAELFSRERLAHDLAEVELARAHCALLRRDPAAALRWARSARRRFVRRGNVPWVARSQLTVCRAELAGALAEEVRRPSVLAGIGRRARDLASEVEGLAGLGPDLARAMRVTAAEAFAAAGRSADARGALDAAGRSTTRESLSVSVQVRTVRARLAADAGDLVAARRQVRAGQRLLAEHRRQLGSVEAVAAAAVHGDRLAEVDVAGALRGQDPAHVLEAVERARATFAGPVRVRPPDDSLLAELLADLRQCVEKARLIEPGSSAARAERAELVAEAARLRASARERAWTLGEGLGAPPAVRARELLADLRLEHAAALGPSSNGSRAQGATPVRTTVVDYVVHGGRVHGVAVDASGLRLLDLADVAVVDELARRLRADLLVLANPLLPAPLRDVAERSLRRGLARLDDSLVASVGAEGPLHVVAAGALLTLPWGLVPSRVGRATSVGPRLQRGSAARAPGVVALAGPGLTHAEAEAEAVAAAWPGATSVVGERADCAAGSLALRTAGVVHLAAHGHHEADNPLFSWVRLADGPLFAHELEGRSLSGAVVVLSACEVGQATVRPGGEVLGLASVLLRLGASSVVASLAPLRDDVALEVMPVMHRLLAQGSNPAAALAAACSTTVEAVPLACFSAAVPLGDGKPGPQEPGVRAA